MKILYIVYTRNRYLVGKLNLYSPKSAKPTHHLMVMLDIV